MNGALYVAIPKNDLSSDVFLGGSACFNVATLFGSGFIPSLVNTNP